MSIEHSASPEFPQWFFKYTNALRFLNISTCEYFWKNVSIIINVYLKNLNDSAFHLSLSHSNR